MGHHHCCSKQKVNRGLWSPEEDEKLVRYISAHGHDCWTSLPKQAGIRRCGKSCRLRWINYLRPDLKRGSFSAQEERIIIDVHRILGNRWAQIAKHLPGRTDNEVKNFWNSCVRKKLIAQGLDPKSHNLVPSNIISHQLNDIKSADLSKSHNNLLSSTAPFTISFPMKRENPMGLLNPSNLMSLPSGATLHESTTPISNSLQYQDTDALMSLKDEINYNDSLEHTNTSSSSCYHQQEGCTADTGMWLACSTEAGGGGAGANQ